MNIHLLKIKAYLKVMAKEIRTLKSQRKELKGYVPGLESVQFQFRANHIAYCMLRGTPLEKIESKLRDPNSFTHARVRKEAARIFTVTMEVMSNESQTLCDRRPDIK